MVTHLDTSFLVDLLRETKRGSDGPARSWLRENQHEPLAISPFVLCELMAGAELQEKPDEERRRVRTVISGLPVALVDERLAATFGKTYAELRKRGQAIGTMDLLIASVALVEGAGLLTANAEHFGRIGSLKVVAYRS